MYREWGHWRAAFASAIFFAVLHPPVAWLPVATLGVVNAQLFRRTGSLTAAVAVHAAYNAVVIFFGGNT
jgi:membrane protease YdiL (CAAX protease family)